MSFPVNISFSHGTLRPQDLIPALLDALAQVHPEAYAQLMLAPFGPVPAHAQEDDGAAWWTDEAPHTVESLIDALNEVAPDGYYFGAHPGDGSDFGFWPDLERCRFCGAEVINPCDAPPPDICEKAINATYGT